MTKIPFNVDAYTARLIGRENVSKLDGAVIELVKNTYDADASICILYYDEKMDTLYLADNGIGMTTEVIKRHWMTIGRSSKKTSFVSNSGRIQTGEKGIGRFALDRIADKCQMLTGTISKDTKLLWTVDWRIFSSGKNITDISADLETSNIGFDDFLHECTNKEVLSLIRTYWDNHGTIFKITEMREKWSKKLIKSIRENLSSLIPYELSATYKIYCFDNEDTRESAEVFSNMSAFSCDYKIQFKVREKESVANGIGDSKVDVKIWREEYDFGSCEDVVLKETGLYEEKKYFHGVPIENVYSFNEILPGLQSKTENNIGEFEGVLYFSKISTTKKDRDRFFQKDITARQDLRETFGGIKIYRDNFRVRPYGEPRSSYFDWLQLARRKNASPAGVASNKGIWRVSADQMLGSIFISRINVTLPDQSNREGIVETEEFRLLKEFIEGIIELLEKDRQYVCRRLAIYYEKTHPTKGIQDEINRKAAEQEKKRQQIYKYESDLGDTEKQAPLNIGIDPVQAKRVLDEKDEQIEELENELKMLRVLATTGIVTNTYIHEFKTLSHRLNMKIVMAKEAIEIDKNIVEAGEYINQANEIREAFNSWFQVTIDAVKKDKRRRKKMDVVRIIKPLVDSWNITLKAKKIDIEFNCSTNQEILLKCFPYEIEIIVNNLIANSTASFDRVRTEKKNIRINLFEDDQYVWIDYSDTGSGLAAIYKMEPERTLKAFETDKRDADGEKIGTGMGMWIVNNTVLDYGGHIDLSKNREAKSGYYATISLRK